MDFGPPDHHQGTCANRGISRIRRLRFSRIIDETKRDTWLLRTVAIHCEFGASWGDMWTHRDATIEIGRAEKLRDRGIVAHNDRAIMTVNPSSLNQTTNDFRAEIPYKYRCSSFVS